ncbi:MAG: MFS transporter [Xanthobacteraceae bacterium]
MKLLFANQGLNYLILHSALHRLAWGGSNIFIGVYLYREGISLADVFLSYCGVFALRFVFRFLLMPLIARIGMRRAFMVGTFLQALQYPLLALVDGVGAALVLFCIASALAAALYFTCYHAFFSMVGDAHSRGLQIGVRQFLMTAAAVLGPALGGLALTFFGPWTAFGAAAVVELASIVPLFALDEVAPAQAAAIGGFAEARRGALLFAADGWITNAGVIAWNLIMFRSLGDRFDVFGGALAAAMLAGAAFGAILGRFIDLGHARKAIWFSAAAYAANLIIKSVCGEDAVIVVAVTILTSLLTGFYLPTLLTVFYNDAKLSSSPLRYQIVAEGAWDVAGVVVTVIAATFCAAGVPLQAALLLALAMVPVQAAMLHRTY